MAIENEDPFSQLSNQGEFNTPSSKQNNSNKGDESAFASLFENTINITELDHSDALEFDDNRAGGHMSGEEEDPEKDALSQYANSVGGWFLSGYKDDKNATTNNNITNNNQNQNQNQNQNPQNNLNPIQQEQLRNQQTMNRYNETQKGLETSSDMIYTFQQNAQDAMGGFNSVKTEIIKESQKDLNEYLQGIKEQLLTESESRSRKKTTPEEADEVFLKLNWLQVKIKEDMKIYRDSKDKSRSWALIFRIMSSLLAAVVTVLLGLNITDYMKSYGIDWFVNFFALLISAFISIIGVIQGFYDVNEIYIKYTDTAYKLEWLQELIEYLEMSKGYITLSQTNQLYRAYYKIISNTQEYEIRIHSESDSKSK